MAAGDPARAILLGHLERIFYHLQAPGPRDETPAQRYILGQHVLDPAISILDILPYDGDVDRDTCAGEHRIHAMKGLKDPFVGISIPGLAGRHIHTLDTL